jgi:hypothetical protein
MEAMFGKSVFAIFRADPDAPMFGKSVFAIFRADPNAP